MKKLIKKLEKSVKQLNTVLEDISKEATNKQVVNKYFTTMKSIGDIVNERLKESFQENKEMYNKIKEVWKNKDLNQEDYAFNKVKEHNDVWAFPTKETQFYTTDSKVDNVVSDKIKTPIKPVKKAAKKTSAKKVAVKGATIKKSTSKKRIVKNKDVKENNE